MLWALTGQTQSSLHPCVHENTRPSVHHPLGRELPGHPQAHPRAPCTVGFPCHGAKAPASSVGSPTVPTSNSRATIHRACPEPCAQSCGATLAPGLCTSRATRASGHGPPCVGWDRFALWGCHCTETPMAPTRGMMKGKTSTPSHSPIPGS